jgi:hypothetical protein
LFFPEKNETQNPYLQQHHMATEIFLSYTRSKNRYNYITQFHDHLQTEFRNKSGNQKATIFFDEEHIAGGEKFDEKIEEELNNAKILLVLLSPTWVNSAYCNKEFDFFSKKDSKKVIIPILWDQIHLPQHNWIEWKDLQYEDWNSTALKKATGKLAEKLNKEYLEFL